MERKKKEIGGVWEEEMSGIDFGILIQFTCNNNNSAIFASIFLKETLGPIGKIGCLLSVVGAVLVVLHAPQDPNVDNIDELLFYALQPGKV